MKCKPSRSFHMIGLGRAGMRIGLRVPSSADVSWLAENLYPGFDLVEIDEPDWLIEVLIDPETHNQLLIRRDQSLARPSTCFGFDGHPGEIFSWDCDPGMFHDDELGLFYCSDIEHRRIVVLADVARDSIRIALLRLVREIATDHLLMLGWLPFHAAAFADKGRGILVVGPKRAGKTSLLLHALEAPSSHPISNDRAVIGPLRGGQLRLEGLPTVVRIREGTTELLGRQNMARAHDWRARNTLDQVECHEPRNNAMLPSIALSLSPHQFHHLVDRCPIAGVALSVIIFPKIDTTIKGISFRRLPLLEATERLACNRLPSGLSPLLHHLAGASDGQCAETMSEHNLTNYPSLECVLGQHAFEDKNFTERVFDQIQT